MAVFIEILDKSKLKSENVLLDNQESVTSKVEMFGSADTLELRLTYIQVGDAHFPGNFRVDI